jgi:hypothetical protein
VIQEYKRLEQPADVGRADEPHDGTVPATPGAQRNPASAGARACFGQTLVGEMPAVASDYCSGGIHFHLHKNVDGDRMGSALVTEKPIYSDIMYL